MYIELSQGIPSELYNHLKPLVDEIERKMGKMEAILMALADEHCTNNEFCYLCRLRDTLLKVKEAAKEYENAVEVERIMAGTYIKPARFQIIYQQYGVEGKKHSLFDALAAHEAICKEGL